MKWILVFKDNLPIETIYDLLRIATYSHKIFGNGGICFGGLVSLSILSNALTEVRILRHEMLKEQCFS